MNTTILLLALVSCCHIPPGVADNIYAVHHEVHVNLPFSDCTDNNRCRCYTSTGGDIVADCHHIKCAVSPKFNPDVTVILLNGNKIPHLPESGFFPPCIKYLDLSSNRLTYMRNRPFDSFPCLEHLDLSKNFLDFTVGYFTEKGMFQNLTSLRTLNLKLNNVKRVSLQAYPEVIGEIKSLQTLRMDGIKGALFPESYQGLQNLTVLDLSGMLTHGICRITSLPSGFFDNTPHLSHLNISGCRLRSVSFGSLSNLIHLRHVNISHNEQLTFRFLSTIILETLQAHILDVSKLHCTYGVGIALYESDMKFFNQTNVTHLYIDSNRLAMLDPGVAYCIPTSLKYVSAKDNRFTMGMYILQFGLWKNVEEFIGDNTYTSHNPSDVTNRFRDCRDWRAPPRKLFQASIEEIADQINVSQHEYERKLTFVTSDKMNRNSELMCYKTGLEPVFNLPPNLTTIRFSKSGLNYIIPCLHFNPDNSVKYLDFSKNILKQWHGPILNLYHLEHLDLSDNYCSFVESDFFKYTTNLRSLSIHNNLLGFVQIGQATFQTLRKLRVLNGSRNIISSLPTSIFSNNHQLEILNLSRNLLYDWKIQLTNLTKLKYLDLSSNQLPFLNRRTRMYVQYNKALKVSLLGNPLQCTCDKLPFLRWIYNNQNKFVELDKYECRFANDTVARFSGLVYIISSLTTQCETYIGVIVAVLIAIVFTVSVLVCGFVYRFRWKLRYIYYMTKNKYGGTFKKTGNIQPEVYIYDAFVSYAEEDEALIREEMVNMLEKYHGFKLCLHQRDFTPGMDIAANIAAAVHNSRQMFIVLSPHYINSKWCMYEFNMGRMEEIYSRDRRHRFMFLIHYKPTPTRDMSLDLLSLIESKSYIEYPTDVEVGEMFWNQVVDTFK